MAHLSGILDRFHSGYEKCPESGCWNSKKAKNKGGYTKFVAFGRTLLFHRVSYELYHGPIPNTMMVCHKCDNPTCVNPDHLFLGTAQDNMDDKIAKGRHKGAPRGERHPGSKLTSWQVSELRLRIDQGENQYSLAKEFGVSQSIISNIKTGKRWSS